MPVQTNIGKLLKDEDERDAIHIAVKSVTANEDLNPGEDIGLMAHTEETVSRDADKLIGIVDPFLKWKVKKGRRFYLFLYPNTITALRHSWEHPAFEKSTGTQKSVSADWLQNFAVNQVGLSLGTLLDGATDYLDKGKYLVDGGRWEGFTVPDEFWDHFENITGRAVDNEQRGNFFSCAC